MFEKMRREEKLMGRSQVEEILKNGEYGIIGLLGENGYPYTIPLNYVFVDGKIYLHGAAEGKKLNDLKSYSNVSFTVVSYINILANKFDTEYDSVIAFRRGKVIEGVSKIEALKNLIKKYSPDYLESGEKYIKSSGIDTAVIEIEIDHITGKIGR